VSKLPFSSLGPDRRAVIAGGLAILAEVMSDLRIRSMHVADGAMREGVLHDLFGRLTSEDAREQTVRSMQARYHVDLQQAARVERTALALWRHAKRSWRIDDPLPERILRWAARLHESGLDVAHSGYHRHGAYLLENADMPGFPREEQRLLARLVRWHRRGLEFDDLADLGDDWRRTAERLIVLLRLAVLLHRNRGDTRPPPLTLVAGRRDFVLRFSRLRSLRRHPLTEADLRQEQRHLAGQGVRLRVVLAGRP
jgi:exopolyphosphatase/guanosine-5'-triphosphate,3'-diphosphate pyrophosphatase